MKKFTFSLLIILIASISQAQTPMQDNDVRTVCIATVYSPEKVSKSDYAYLYGLTQGALNFSPDINAKYKTQEETNRLVKEACTQTLLLEQKSTQLENMDNFTFAYIFQLGTILSI